MKRFNVFLVLLCVLINFISYSQTVINSNSVASYDTAAEGDLFIDENEDYYIGQQDGSLKVIGGVKKLISSDGSIIISENNSVYNITSSVGHSETTTNLNQDNNTGIITYTNENGINQTANTVSSDAGNSISIGTDGGAYRGISVIDLYDNAGNQTIANTYTKINLNTQRINIGAYPVSSNGDVGIPVNGLYQLTYSVGFFTASTAFLLTDTRSELRLNNVKIDGSEVYTSHVISPSSSQSASRTIYLNLVAGDVINIFSIIDSGNGNILTISDGCGLSITKLN
jgi:hypothetical protein